MVPNLVKIRSTFLAVSSFRQCSRTACAREAVATLTYVYSDSTAVLGPLAVAAEPHSYDLCQAHASRLTAPRGWEVVRVAVPGDAVQGIYDESESSVSSSSGSVPGLGDTLTRRQLAEVRAKEQEMLDQSAPELDEFEQRKLEISKPLTQPDDDWAAIADVVRHDEPAAPVGTTVGVSASSPVGAAGVGAAIGAGQPTGRRSAGAPVPEGFIPPESLVRPRHAADPEPVQKGEVARRGHLRMLRDDS